MVLNLGARAKCHAPKDLDEFISVRMGKRAHILTLDDDVVGIVLDGGLADELLEHRVHALVEKLHLVNTFYLQVLEHCEETALLVNEFHLLN